MRGILPPNKELMETGCVPILKVDELRPPACIVIINEKLLKFLGEIRADLVDLNPFALAADLQRHMHYNLASAVANIVEG